MHFGTGIWNTDLIASLQFMIFFIIIIEDLLTLSVNDSNLKRGY